MKHYQGSMPWSKYARLIKEYEEMVRPPGKETNKEEAAKDEELHRKMEEMLSLMSLHTKR